MLLHFETILPEAILSYDALQRHCIAQAGVQLTRAGHTYKTITFHQLTLKEFLLARFVAKVEGLN
jgi:hypothetical protein